MRRPELCRLDPNELCALHLSMILFWFQLSRLEHLSFLHRLASHTHVRRTNVDRSEMALCGVEHKSLLNSRVADLRVVGVVRDLLLLLVRLNAKHLLEATTVRSADEQVFEHRVYLSLRNGMPTPM